MGKTLIKRGTDWSLNQRFEYAKWVQALARAIWKATGNDDLPDIYVYDRDWPDNWLWRIKIEMKYPRWLWVEAWVDLGNQATRPFLRELYLRTKIQARVKCNLYEREGEWEGVRDLTIRLNETPGMLDKLHAVRDPPPGWRGFRSALDHPFTDAECIGPTLPPRNPNDPWPWEIDTPPPAPPDQTIPRELDRRTEEEIMATVKTSVEVKVRPTWCELAARVTPRGETMRIKEFVDLAAAIETALKERKPRAAKPDRGWIQEMADQLRESPDLVRICNEYFEEEYGGGRARQKKRRRSWGL